MVSLQLVDLTPTELVFELNLKSLDQSVAGVATLCICIVNCLEALDLVCCEPLLYLSCCQEVCFSLVMSCLRHSLELQPLNLQSIDRLKSLQSFDVVFLGLLVLLDSQELRVDV